MKRKLLVSLLMLNCVGLITAKDVILKTNGEEINVKVSEVGASEVKYKKASNLSGPTYTIAKSEVFMITYESGEKDVFGRGRTTTTAENSTEVDSAATAAESETEKENIVVYTITALVPEEAWDF